MTVFVTADKEVFFSEEEAVNHEASLNQDQVVGLDNVIAFPSKAKIENPEVSLPVETVEEKEEEPIHNYSHCGSEGSKYRENSNLSIKEIAALIRKEARAFAKKNGIKVSVKYDGFSGGTSIDMRITEITFNPYSEEYTQVLKDGKVEEWTRDWYTNGRPKQFNEKYNSILKELNRIHGQYNYDDCDYMTDYFSVNYYGNVQIDWECNKKIEKIVSSGEIK